MKKIFFCLSILLLCSIVVFAQGDQTTQKVLENLSTKLTSIKTIKYDYHYITNFPSQHTYQDIFGKVYLDYSSVSHNKENNNDPRMAAYKLDFTYQVTDEGDLPIYVYNGTEFFNVIQSFVSSRTVQYLCCNTGVSFGIC